MIYWQTGNVGEEGVLFSLQLIEWKKKKTPSRNIEAEENVKKQMVNNHNSNSAKGLSNEVRICDF